jgi:hypothetical protein
MTETFPYRDPHRAPLRFRPIKAFGHFRKLIADKEDTEQVFQTVCQVASSRHCGAHSAEAKQEKR